MSLDDTIRKIFREEFHSALREQRPLLSKPKAEWITVAEAVAITGKRERTIRRWVDDNKVGHKRDPGGRILIDTATLATAEPEKGKKR